MSDHLRGAQQKLSNYIVAAGTAPPKGVAKRERAWPRLPSRFIGDDIRDPTPPDPRLGVPIGPRRKKAEESEAKAA
jgi:hypothetical protein